MRFSIPGRLSNAPTIFISYRRDDTSGYAGRLHDALRVMLGNGKVRMDVDDFAAGGEFAVEAKEMVAQSDVLLALIGKRWVEGANATRLADPADLLRHEIETALENGVRVIPVLVNGAQLPDAAALPGSLHPLLQRNAFELSERRWDYDVNDLITTLCRTSSRGPAAGEAGTGARGPGARTGAWKLAMLAVVVAALVIAGTLYRRRPSHVQPSSAASRQDWAAMPPVVRRNDGSVFSIDHERFFNAFAAEFGDLKPEARSGLEGLLYLVDADSGLADLRWAAYLLATIKHETAGRWLPIEEFGKGRGLRYGDTVVVTDAEGRRYRNVYYGRGYIQLTQKEYYERMGQRLRNRLLYEPDLALEPSVSYAILSIGMRDGMFTDYSLGQFLNSKTCDYRNARRVVNGTDQAERIAGYAMRLERVLRKSTPPPTGFRTLTSLNVRTGPSAAENQIGAPLPLGTLVRELETRGSWKRIAVPGGTVSGWVPGSFLQPAADAGPPCSPRPREQTPK